MKTGAVTVDSVVQNPFGEGAKFHHVGLGVSAIEKLSPESTPVEDPIQKVRVAFIELNGMIVELLEPVGEDSPVRQSLEKGSKLLHLCYTVPDMDVALKHSRQFGFRCIRKPVPAVAFNNRRIAWIFSLQYGLIELLEERSPDVGI